MKLAYLFLLAGLAVACNSSNKNEEGAAGDTTAASNSAAPGVLANYDWLPGTWTISMGPSGSVTEIWNRQDDSTLTGETFMTDSAGNKQPIEVFELRRRAGTTYYVPTIMGQNNNQPVEFKVTSEDATGFTAEKPEHDYPNKLVYKKDSDTSLTATIEGIQDGKPAREEFKMTKQP